MPVSMFPVLFAIPRTSGWIAQWLEMVTDKEQKIARPRQIYTGALDRDYVSVEQRSWRKPRKTPGKHPATCVILVSTTVPVVPMSVG